MKAMSVERLEAGMTLARTVTNGNMVILFSEGTVLSDAHLTRLKTLDIPVVYIKDDYDLSHNYQQAAAVREKAASYSHEFDVVSKFADDVFNSIEDGKIPKDKTDKVAAHILPLADNSGTVDYLFALGHKNTTLSLHSERVAIIAGLIAKWMHFNWDEIRTVVNAAFLHDIGKIKFPDRLVGKNPDNLKGDDINTYRNHCIDGEKILREAKFSDIITKVALSHHEKMNGAGFPKGLKGEAIHPYARIVAVADIYDNLTSERPGSIKKTPFDAVKFIIKEIYSGLDPVVCVPLLTRIKDSLIGSRVTLSDGRKGAVAMYPNDFSAMPIIALDDGASCNLNNFSGLNIVEYN